MDNPQEVLAGVKTSKRHFVLLFLLALGLGGLFWVGYRPWKDRQQRLVQAAAIPDEPLVTTVAVTRAKGTTELSFPSLLSADSETPIYARSDGYIKSRMVDIGDHVKAGQLLVEIDTPELDEQLRQSQYRYNQFKAASGATMAALVSADANLKLAETVLRRTKGLVDQGILSKQELDDKQALRDVKAAERAAAQAAVESAEEGKRAVNSDIERLRSSTKFQQVLAPFAGIISARSCEVGTLVSSNAGRELFRLADPTSLRVVIQVPQPDAPFVRAGMAARLTIGEFQGRFFEGKVARTAGVLDPATKAMLTEVQIPNRDSLLLPGMFGNVKLTVTRTTLPLLIPGDTPVVRSDGTFVAVVGRDKVVHFRKLSVGKDLGSQLEILDGLNEGDRVVVNPADDVREGVKVRVADEKRNATK